MKVFDITSLYRTATSVSGIVRCEMELAKRALGDQSFVFVVYVDGHWYSLSHEAARDVISKILATPSPPLPTNRRYSRVSAFLSSLKYRILTLENKVLSGRALEIRSNARNLLRSAIIFIRSLLKSLQKLFYRQQAVKSIGDILDFSEVTVYFSCGLDWEDKDLTHLYRHKKKFNFRVHLFCYDVILEDYPHFSYPGARDRVLDQFVNLCWCADVVYYNAEKTKNDLLRFAEKHGLPSPFLRKLPLGQFDMPEAVSSSSLDVQSLGDYVLTVGTVEPRKNYELLYSVWCMLDKRYGRNAKRLVIVGKKGWGSDDLLSKLRLDKRTKDSVIILENVDDGTLGELYRKCLFFIFPSFSEGYGLPPAEALSIGKPVVVSDCEALVETSQGCAEVVSPYDAVGWCNMVSRLYDDKVFRDSLSERAVGFRIVSWDDVFLRLKESLN